MLGKIEDRGEADDRAGEDEMVGWKHQFSGHEFEQTQERVMEAWYPAVHGVTKNQTRLTD